MSTQQKKQIQYNIRNEYKEALIILCAGRGWGKSYFGAELAVERSHEGDSLVILENQMMLEHIAKEYIVTKSPDLIYRRSSSEVVGSEGNKVKLFNGTSEKERLFGIKADFAWVDLFGHNISSEIIEAAFYRTGKMLVTCNWDDLILCKSMLKNAVLNDNPPVEDCNVRLIIV